jgi:formylglycine-generating enzyme required for sulfatase activity
VPYTYEIGKTEVTSAQYAAFLTAVASNSDNYGLYSEMMDSSSYSYGCNITRSLSDGVYTYTAMDPEKPVNFVMVYDAMRFANWLTNGASDGADTETGVYTLSGGSVIPSNPTVGRNLEVNGATLTGTGILARFTGTVWALASEDEWYKAAYYNVETGAYSLYPNGTDEINGSDANYYDESLLDVGILNKEQNGTYDMAGNAFEWTDTLITGFNGANITEYNARVTRGGSFAHSVVMVGSSDRYYESYEFDAAYHGFRVVLLTLTAVPEPGTYAAAMGLLMLVIGMWVRRGRRTRV